MKLHKILPFILIILLTLTTRSSAASVEDVSFSSNSWQFRTAAPTMPDDVDHFEWVWQGGGDINDIFMIDQYYGWAAGDNLLLSTTDGGATWQARDAVVGTDRAFKNIHFVDRQTGWLVGSHGYRDQFWNKAVILRTTDGGETWQEQWSGESDIDILDQVQFIDANRGWAADYWGHLLRTTDGGMNWTVVGDSTPGPFFFLDTTTGWTVGWHQGVYYTNDGGNTWTRRSDVASPTFNTIWFADAQHGWMTGRQWLDHSYYRGVIFATTDGGFTWTEQYHTSDLADSGGLNDIFFKDVSNGWAVGSDAHILSTTNGGASWIPQDSDVTADFQSISVVGDTLWVAGEGAITVSEDDGVNWNAQGKPWPKLHSIVALDEEVAWAAGEEGTILRTTDAGRTWEKQSDVPNLDWYSVSFSSMADGWAVGEGGNSIATADGGETWSLNHTGANSDLHDVYFPDSTQGWAVGDDGVIRHTNDGGLNWTAQSSHVAYHLQAVHFVDALEGWIVGVDPIRMFEIPQGVLLHTTDGGQTWSNLGDKGGWDVDFVGHATGWTLESHYRTFEPAYHSHIFRTTDGGATWTEIDTLWTGFGRSLRAVDFVSPGNGWLGGSSLLRTGTGGERWWPKLVLTGAGITDLAFVSPDVGWAVGKDGLILHRRLKPMSQVAIWEDDTCVQEDVDYNRVDWIKVRLGQSDRNYTSGFRFKDLDIPQGATIQQAKLSLPYADWHRGLPVSLKVYAEDTDFSTSFSNANPLANHRPLTSSSIDWVITETPPAWFDSPDLAAVIQEVVDHPDWKPGNALSLIIRDNSEDGDSHYLDVKAYDLNANFGAKLSVAYYVPDVTPSDALWLPMVMDQ